MNEPRTKERIQKSRAEAEDTTPVRREGVGFSQGRGRTRPPHILISSSIATTSERPGCSRQPGAQPSPEDDVPPRGLVSVCVCVCDLTK